MTSRSSAQIIEQVRESPSAEKPPVRKRIRDNHNELERVRRNNQKAQLEALRMALPFQDMDDKASMVSIFVRAREYIRMLEQRIIELQSDAGLPADTIVLPHFDQKQHDTNFISVEAGEDHPQQLGKISSPTQTQNSFNQRERLLSINPDQVQMHHGIPFYNSGFMNSISSSSTSSAIDLSSLMSPRTSPLPPKLTSPLRDQNLNADILRSFVSDNFIKNGSLQRLSADEDNNLLKNFHMRRSSSLILPFECETVMIQKRDSLSALFSGLIPEFVDTAIINSSGDILCHKCQKGMCNMIMIDCDHCHKWYHIKCARIDSNCIPTQWNCC